MSEDCMTVNIFRQKPKDETKVPVAVYIHGGAYNRGSCEFSLFFTFRVFKHVILHVLTTHYSAMMHDTASMVAFSESPFIGVSFNYRFVRTSIVPIIPNLFLESVLMVSSHQNLLLKRVS